MKLVCYTEGFTNLPRFVFDVSIIAEIAELMRCLCVMFVYDGYYFKDDSHMHRELPEVHSFNEAQDLMAKIVNPES